MDSAAIELPSSRHAREFVKEGGQSVTFLHVALDVLNRFGQKGGEQDESEREDELRFLRDCLLAGHSKTQMSCALVAKGDGNDQVKSDIRKSFSQMAKSDAPSQRPSMRMRGSMTMKDRSDLDAANFLDNPSVPWMGEAIPEFPRFVADKTAEGIRFLFEGIMSWNFDIFKLLGLAQGRPLQMVGWEVLRFSGIFGEFSLGPAKTARFLEEVERRYSRPAVAPYHNNIHAADVTQTLQAIIFDLGVREYLDPFDVFAMLFAAIIHDMGHDGRNNAFHINKQDQLALTYNDRSVLENFHVASAFKLPSEIPEANIGSTLEKEQRTLLRRGVIDMVMGTDMAHHFARVGDFGKLAEELKRTPESWKNSEKNMDVLRSMVLHTADIANPAKPFQIAERWSMRALAEFFKQGDEEKRLGLPVSPMCCRKTTSVSGSQTGFIGFIVLPTYQALSVLLPNVNELIEQIINVNKSLWDQHVSDNTPGLYSLVPGEDDECAFEERGTSRRQSHGDVYGPASEQEVNGLRRTSGSYSEVEVSEGNEPGFWTHRQQRTTSKGNDEIGEVLDTLPAVSRLRKNICCLLGFSACQQNRGSEDVM
eukprot:TRINITY_DN10853_c0_g1_i2.p1 TRINITY_DN10853_c0_g1~~TRINITY_DN10853_c0_g1_i2.p1  ORF type:complete len:592 (-),score=78.58 TRINITY_DN10853_c0_g1_i2:27-1802(-)